MIDSLWGMGIGFMPRDRWLSILAPARNTISFYRTSAYPYVTSFTNRLLSTRDIFGVNTLVSDKCYHIHSCPHVINFTAYTLVRM